MVSYRNKVIGILICANGDVYKGEWKNDLKNGKGLLTYSNGDTYEGDWLNDEKNGQGKEVIKYRDVVIW